MTARVGMRNTESAAARAVVTSGPVRLTTEEIEEES